MDEGIRARLGLPQPVARPSVHDLRVFGGGLAVLLTLLAALAWRKGSGAAPWELGLAAVAVFLARCKPSVLEPLYQRWMRVAETLGRVNTYIAMAMIYYLVITPYGIVIRLCGKDLLDEKLRDRNSYWHTRDNPASPGESSEAASYRNQF